MEHCIIETKRLVLRPFEQADTAPYTEIMTNANVTKYLGRRTRKTPEDVKKMLCSFEKQWQSQGFGVWAVALRRGAG